MRPFTVPPKISSSPLVVAVVDRECPYRGKRGGSGAVGCLGERERDRSCIRSVDHGYGCVGNFLDFSIAVDGEDALSSPSENPCCCLHKL